MRVLGLIAFLVLLTCIDPWLVAFLVCMTLVVWSIDGIFLPKLWE